MNRDVLNLNITNVINPFPRSYPTPRNPDACRGFTVHVFGTVDGVFNMRGWDYVCICAACYDIPIPAPVAQLLLKAGDPNSPIPITFLWARTWSLMVHKPIGISYWNKILSHGIIEWIYTWYSHSISMMVCFAHPTPPIPYSHHILPFYPMKWSE